MNEINDSAIDSAEQFSLRGKAVAYMRAMALVEWTPHCDMDFTAAWPDLVYTAGARYRGLPYVNFRNSSLEEFSAFIDEEGVYAGPAAWTGCAGVDCSSAVLAAWGAISSSFDYVWSLPMMQYAVPVGDYTIPEGFSAREEATSCEVIALNDRQTIYKAYAQLQPGDAVVKYKTAGHVRMICERPVVFYDDNGGIDDTSYVTAHEITVPVFEHCGYKTSWKIDTPFSFADLHKTDYLPVTCKELIENKAEEPALSIDYPNSAMSIRNNGGFAGLLQSNYRIFMVEAVIRDKSGNIIRQPVEYPANAVDLRMVSKSYDLARLNSELDIGGLGTGNYTLTLSAKTAGQNMIVYETIFEAKELA